MCSSNMSWPFAWLVMPWVPFCGPCHAVSVKHSWHVHPRSHPWHIYGAVLAGTGTWRLIHVRHEVDKVVRVEGVVGVGLRESCPRPSADCCVLLSVRHRYDVTCQSHSMEVGNIGATAHPNPQIQGEGCIQKYYSSSPIFCVYPPPNHQK